MATSAECSEQGAFGKDFGKSCVTSDLLQQCASGLIRNAAFDSQSALADGGIDGGRFKHERNATSKIQPPQPGFCQDDCVVLTFV